MQKSRKKIKKSGRKDVKIFSNSLETLTRCLLSLKKNSKFKEGIEYVDSFLEEIDTTREKIEEKVEAILAEEKKRLTYHFDHLEKFIKAASKTKPARKRVGKSKKK